MDRLYLADAFHPATLGLYFACMVVLSACIPSLIFSAASFVSAMIVLALVDGAQAAKLALAMEALIFLLAVLSPLFDPLGATVLFTYWGARPYTLEAMLYGASVALIFAAMIAWFAVMGKVLTTEKLAYLFGGSFPQLGFVVISTLTLVPRLLRRAKEMARASAREVSVRGRIASAGVRLVNLIRWALAEGAMRADAMASRGFATGRRSSYVRYRFTVRDGVSIACIVALAALAASGAVAGGAHMTYFPAFVPGSFDGASILSIIAFGALALALPAMIGWGCLRWCICASRI